MELDIYIYVGLRSVGEQIKENAWLCSFELRTIHFRVTEFRHTYVAKNNTPENEAVVQTKKGFSL